jgi:hypothetical protein
MEHQQQLKNLISNDRLKQAYTNMNQLVKNKKNLHQYFMNMKQYQKSVKGLFKGKYSAAVNRIKILKKYKDAMLQAVQLVTVNEFKEHFHDCIKQVKSKIDEEPYGLLLGQVPLSINKRKNIKSSVFLAHVVERYMGRRANLYVTLNTMNIEEIHTLSHQKKVRRWIWFDDGVYSGQQLFTSFVNLYSQLQGKFYIIAPYATPLLKQMIPLSVKDRVEYICTKVTMKPLDELLAEAGIPKKEINKQRRNFMKAVQDGTINDPNLQEAMVFGAYGRTLYILPHKIPNYASFEFAQDFINSKVPLPIYKQ